MTLKNILKISILCLVAYYVYLYNVSLGLQANPFDSKAAQAYLSGAYVMGIIAILTFILSHYKGKKEEQ